MTNNTSKAGIWIPVIVAIVSGLFSLSQALISAQKVDRVTDVKKEIEKLNERTEENRNQLTKINEDVEARIAQLNQETSFGDNLPVGTIVASFLEPEQFYKYYNGEVFFDKNNHKWCFANGKENIVNTDYFDLTGLTKINDLRGYFLRGLDISGTIDSDGTERKLGSSQKDLFQGHGHNIGRASGFDMRATAGSTGGDELDQQRFAIGSSNSENIGEIRIGIPGNSGFGTPRFGLETRPKNIAVNYYIKINK